MLSHFQKFTIVFVILYHPKGGDSQPERVQTIYIYICILYPYVGEIPFSLPENGVSKNMFKNSLSFSKSRHS